MTRVLIIGGGDMADRIAHGLAASGRVRSIIFASVSHRVAPIAATLASCHDVAVEVHLLDGRDTAAVEALLRSTRPDLIIQSAALMSPWALAGRSDPVATSILSGGLGLRLPLQIPVLMSVMTAVRETGFAGPVANLSFPDVTHPLLHRVGLAPTIGLGNVAMYLVRARAALRQELGPEADMPLVRVVGQHGTVYDVMAGRSTSDPSRGPWVWLGDEGNRRDELAYRGDAVPQGGSFNAVTAAASLPILFSLLPGAAPLRWSAPGPLGLMGGYPVRIDGGEVTLDLPEGVALKDCEPLCTAAAAGDGIASVDDGVVTFTASTQAAVRMVDPQLAEPFTLDQTERRAALLLSTLST